MKHIINIIFIILLLVNFASAQDWNFAGNTPGSTDFLGSTNAADLMFYTNNAERARIIGVNTSNRGFLGLATNSPSSVLHIDGNGTPTTTGETFRTNGPSGSYHRWRMYTNSSEIFRIEHPTGGSSINMKVMNNYPMRFYTNDILRLFIDLGNSNTTGHVGIGNTFDAPASRLHLNQSSSSGTAAENDNWFQITTKSNYNGVTSDPAATDGLRIGVIDASKNVEIKQQEEADIYFYTHNGSSVGQRVIITEDGEVGIGDMTPDFVLDVEGAIISGSTLAIGASATLANLSNNTNTAGTFIANSASHNYGVKCSTVVGASTPVTNTGGSFYTEGASANNYGVQGQAISSETNVFNYGGWFKAQSGANNRAVYGATLVTGTNNYGGYFEALNGTNNNYGVYASGGNANCANGAGMCPDAAGFFSGDVYTTSGYFASDEFLKDNISALTGASSILSQLSPKTYTFKTQDYPSMHLSDKNQYGLIADDVMQILPELVRSFNEPEVTDDEGNTVYDEVTFKALNYNQLIPILIAGFQEQQAQIDDLQTQLDGCCNQRISNPANDNTGSIELENIEGLQLQQNDPNPFSESTMIKWNLPDEFQNAVLYFYDNSGNQINSYKVNAKGAGELQIFGSKLSSGVYTYTLVVDGKVTDSKKMVKTSK